MSSGMDVFDPRSEDESYDLTLPVSRPEFADFLGKIIGGKDKLEYSFRGNIHITSEVISGIEAALLERVESQNGGRMVSARYDIRFSNGRSFKTSSLEKLLALSPRGDAVTEFFGAEFVFLIYYPGSTTPAREKISVAFSNDKTGIVRDQVLGTFDFDRAKCEIEYFNRVFAEDCLNTVTSVVEQHRSEADKVSFLKGGGPLDAALGITIFACAAIVYCVGVYVVGGHLGWGAHATSIANLTLQEKIDLIIARSAPYFSGIATYIFLVIGVIFSVLPALIVSSMLPSIRITRVSFGIYQNDNEEIERAARRKSRRLIKAMASVLFSIALSVVGAYLYDRLMGRL